LRQLNDQTVVVPYEREDLRTRAQARASKHRPHLDWSFGTEAFSDSVQQLQCGCRWWSHGHVITRYRT
jgi:hypothetical protein